MSVAESPNVEYRPKEVVHKVRHERLSNWIRSLIESAEKDESFGVCWFGDTRHSPFCIVGGWMGDFSGYSELYYTSKSEPKYAMCVKIVVNDGSHATDFESMTMPVDKNGSVDDTCLALMREDDPAAVATFFLGEWERLTQELCEGMVRRVANG